LPLPANADDKLSTVLVNLDDTEAEKLLNKSTLFSMEKHSVGPRAVGAMAAPALPLGQEESSCRTDSFVVGPLS
jgi:hypothetical protein